MTVDIRHRSFEETLLACEALGGVDLIVTSPPYPDARPGQYGGDASHDFTWPDYQRLGDHVVRALKPGGFCAVNIDGPVRFWRDDRDPRGWGTAGAARRHPSNHLRQCENRALQTKQVCLESYSCPPRTPPST